MLHILMRTDQQGGKQNILLVSSPSPLEQGQQAWMALYASPLGQWDKAQLKRVVIDPW